MYNPFSLEGKTILITGASSGIGRSTAIECSRMGAKLCIAGRNQERLKSTFNLLEGNGHLCFVLDLTDDEQTEVCVQNLPVLDGIVHAAGIMPKEGTLAFFYQKEEIDKIMEVNFFSIVKLNSLLFEEKRIKTHASIVHIGSLITQHTGIGLSSYSASKNALAAYSRVVAAEMRHKKIRSNLLMPGMIDSDSILEMTQNNTYLEDERKRYPFGFGRPEDVAWACVYFLSNASRWITGTQMLLNGGRMGL